MVKPTHTKTVEMVTVILGEVFLVNMPETIPPIQKKHIVRVKLRANWEGDQPNSDARGAFRMDQA
jgi:hypothetical protein